MKPLKVNQKEAGTRLDLFLVQRLKVSRKKVKHWIDQGKTFIGTRKIIIASWKLQLGDSVEIRESSQVQLPRRRRYLKVYFEDMDLLVVEKPPGVACEQTPQTLTSTLVDDINDYLIRAHPDRPHPYLGLMHRLDRETSGLMVYTVSQKANQLSQQFKKHSVGRRYLALVEGALSPAQGRINRPLRKDPAAQGKKMQVLKTKEKNPPGRAMTDYLVQERYGTATLVEARLLTGRTHQVRAHFASLGHPVLGDSLYGSTFSAPRHMLHACYLEFHHPGNGKKMIFKSDPPKDFQKVLEKIRGENLRLRSDPKNKIKKRKRR